MKKLITLLLAASIATTLISCSSDEKKEETNNNEVQQEEIVEENETKEEEKTEEKSEDAIYEDVDLVAVADSLYEGLGEDEKPMVMSMPIEDAETFTYFTFIDYEDGLKAVANEPMMSSIAHSIVLVECPTAEKATEIAAAMKENCDPRKWMCVEADIVEGVTNGNIAMLLMTTAEGGMAETILSNFNSLDEEKISVLKSEAFEEDFNEEFEEESEEVDADAEVSEEAETETEEVETAPEIEEKAPVETPKEDKKDKQPKPETIVVPEDAVIVYPEDSDAGENVPATMPEASHTPAVEPEAEEAEETASADENVTIDTLYTMADSLYDGINMDEMPMVGTIELTADNFEYSAFVPYNSSYLAVESMPMMGSTPHSVVIVKTNSPEEASALASAMEANADPRKWICVNARRVKSASKGNYAILVMVGVDVMPGEGVDEAKAEQMSEEQSEERANIIINNFLKSVK